MRREILASRTPETLTRTRYEHKLLLGEEEALALEIAVADRLALKLFPCGEATRIVTLYLDRRDGLLSRHALAARGAHLRIRVKAFFAATDAPPATPGLALEVKRRRFGLTRKERVWCLPPELPVLLAATADPRARRLRLDRIAPDARPLCLVGYVRRVYEDPAAMLRVTIDRRLGWRPAGGAELAQLAQGLAPEIPPAPGAPVVAEIKHLGPLPGWIEAAAGRARPGFSKLVWALSALAGR
jgi:hypothetical protein